MMFELLYPERHWVDGEKIEIWYLDAIANNEVKPPYATDVRAMAMELSDIGHITIGRIQS
jgi:hypothetical protein